MDQEALAKVLYDRYCQEVGGKAFNGDPLPKSDEFFKDSTKTKQANAWRTVAGSAITICTQYHNSINQSK